MRVSQNNVSTESRLILAPVGLFHHDGHGMTIIFVPSTEHHLELGGEQASNASILSTSMFNEISQNEKLARK